MPVRKNPLQRTIWIAVILYLVDVFVLSQGLIAIVTLLIVVVAAIPRASWAAFKKNWSLFRPRVYRICIYVAMAVAILGSIRLNAKIAVQRAERLIASCRQYETKYHHLPAKLDDLVPEFLSSIPKAKYTLMFNDFTYWKSGETYRLRYVAFPPFDRRIYNFESGKWSSLD